MSRAAVFGSINFTSYVGGLRNLSKKIRWLLQVLQGLAQELLPRLGSQFEVIHLDGSMKSDLL